MSHLRNITKTDRIDFIASNDKLFFHFISLDYQFSMPGDAGYDDFQLRPDTCQTLFPAIAMHTDDYMTEIWTGFAHLPAEASRL
ncbi:MAG: hypothetical protein CVV51_07810 [Spirochaetae bacterium HGW-Spirochaetae-7]|jgi:hypothetical protein|nr:MAG: hypothetical protein CVV51_07810 [Spirochaetae bacterium HGW-Spirochaetae-7]